MGNKESSLSSEALTELKRNTHFNEKEINVLLERYNFYDQSPQGDAGITICALVAMPELTHCPFAKCVAWSHLKDGKEKLSAKGYLELMSLLSTKASPEEKRRALFDALDVHKDGLVKFEELFRLQKAMYNPVISDEQITQMLVDALQREDLEGDKSLRYDDFKKMVSLTEVYEKMTVDLHL